jgi:hypothetical protein
LRELDPTEGTLSAMIAGLLFGLLLPLGIGSCRYPTTGDTTNVYLNNLGGSTSSPGSTSNGGSVVDQVVVTPGLVETVNGQRVVLTAQPFAGTLPLAGIPILWATTDPSIANIQDLSTSSTVTIKAEGIGEADVIARAGSAEGRARIKVRASN